MSEQHILYQAIDKLVNAEGGKTVRISPRMAQALLSELARLPHLRPLVEQGKGKSKRSVILPPTSGK